MYTVVRDARPASRIRSVRTGSSAHPSSLALRVEVLGSTRISRGTTPLSSLGGPKAGANQALGLFAFLFDRDARGVDKDEAIEMIWPEFALGAGDLAFHRTLLGLRRTLADDTDTETIEFRAGRYFLRPDVVAWSDLAELEDLLDASAAEPNPARRIEFLERCRRLNRGAFMDDCPFYGTSAYVEVRRSLVTSVSSAVLLELADLYAAAGHSALAAMRRGEVELVA